MKSFAMNQTTAEVGSRIAHALEVRRASSLAGEIPWSWLLDSPGLVGVVETAKRLARAPGVPALIEGERGTGVSELARLIHEEDPIARAGQLRLLAASTVSSVDARGSVFAGTLFLEDIENLRPAAQTWITELLARRSELPTPLRIIGSSRLSVSKLLEHEGLSPELVLLLDVGRLVLPPLRARPTDILRLARRFLQHYGQWQNKPWLRFSHDAECKLLAHSYPANVQELRNVVERAAVLTATEEVGEESIVVFDPIRETIERSETARSVAATGAQAAARFPTLAEVERDYLASLIRKFEGQRTLIARTMGISYSTVLNKIKKHHLDVRAILDAIAVPIEGPDQ